MLNAIILLTNVGTLGISSIVIKFAAEVHETDSLFRVHSNEVLTAGFLILLMMSTLTAGVLIYLRHFIANNLDVEILIQKQFSNALLVIALAIFPQFLSRIPQGFLLSQYKNVQVRQIETAYSILLWGGALLIAFSNKNLIMVALWCLLDGFFLLGTYLLALKRITHFSLQLNLLLMKRMLGFSGFMLIELVAMTLFHQMDRIIVGFVLGPTIAGIYSVGTSVGLRMAMITGQATDVMIPYASLKDSAHDRTRLYLVFRKLSKYISILVAGLGGVLVVWMDEILSLWISPEFSSNYSHIFRLFIVGYGLLSLSRPAHQTLTGIGKVRATSLIYSGSTFIMLISLFFLSKQFGLTGATVANFVPVLLLAMHLYVYKEITGRIGSKDLLQDLKWGLFIPTFILFMMPLVSSVLLKIVITVSLLCLVGYIVINDDWAEPWLTNQIKYIIRRVVSDA